MKYPESNFVQSCEGRSANIGLLISNKMMGFHIKSKENPFKRRQCYFCTFDKSAYLIILKCHYITRILSFSFKSLCHFLSFNLSGGLPGSFFFKVIEELIQYLHILPHLFHLTLSSERIKNLSVWYNMNEGYFASTITLLFLNLGGQKDTLWI